MKKKRSGRYTAPLPKFRLRELGDAALWRKAGHVLVPIEADERAVEAMTALMVKSGAIGLAGPQVAYSRRVVVWLDEKQRPRHILDPEIVTLSPETNIYHEGCLSVPEVFIDLERANSAFVCGMDLDGAYVEIDAKGLQARVLQHEVDHLDGKTMFDRATPEQRNAFQNASGLRLQMPGAGIHITREGGVKIGAGVLADL